MINRTQSVFGYELHQILKPSVLSGSAYALSFGQTHFRIDGATNMTYAVAGSYTRYGSQYAYLFANLYEYGHSNSPLLYDLHSNTTTPDVTMTLGSSAGSQYYQISGSLIGTGLLQAGHDYVFFYQTEIDANPASDDYIIANGGISITFSPSNAIPEPATIVVWSLLGTLAITVGRRLRKRVA
jgi:hypothetical protein